MRELHADRSDADGTAVIVVDLESGEEFSIPVDPMLRSLVHPPEPESTPDTAAKTADAPPAAAPPPAADPAAPVRERTLSPREIQARVRAGASVAEVAEATGVSEDKISRFAHPVLLERGRAAELARASHPMGVDGPAAATLGEIVAECLVLRGSSPQSAQWDAWRTEAGQWVVRVAPDPDVDVHAHWRFTPGSHGGTTDPMDDLAVELTEPELARTLQRTGIIGSVPDRDVTDREALDVAEAGEFSDEPAAEHPTREVSPDGHEYVTVSADDLTDRQQRRRQGFGEVLDLRFDDESEVPAPPATEHDTTTGRHRGKRATPTVPTWEDVLLGVRSHPNE